jgi:hypothetical protein
MDLVWSVGGSPAYGGVSYDEASAVYHLIEDYRGPGMASPTLYTRVEQYAKGDSERLDALKAFRINDEITSAPDSFDTDVVARGSRLADKLGHDGLRCLFLAYEGELAHRAGDLAHARDVTIEALNLGLAVAAEDPAYAKRMAQLAQNAVALTGLAGDSAGAARLEAQLAELLDPDLLQGDWER